MGLLSSRYRCPANKSRIGDQFVINVMKAKMKGQGKESMEILLCVS